MKPEFYHVGVKFFSSNSGTYVYRVPSSSKLKITKGDLVIVPPNLMRNSPTVATVEQVSYDYKEKKNINYVTILGVSKL
ncbi:hypothetical protein P13BB106kb_p038 [Pectobacterium phage DU_PP_V]|uniref:Uncharacterized protein n=1 Tax=Pectobacterium phage DU_PP_V TaxID=2041492 RepID=A0A2D2W6U9_9CAUD|nr:hypothetical protein HOS40_gp038 [Pectobacterium phage DU_PP_V]ATS94022.1 hypothetical protein P13BB106kb_p038 [Pectobacterium phage DU_PP_V]